MTDSELLELAAKAAGIESRCVKGFEYRGLRINPNKEPLIVWWNPLTDDGDALRLAVILGVDLVFNKECIDAFNDTRCEWVRQFVDETNNDPYAATRRAIVRAAAEIGKQND